MKDQELELQVAPMSNDTMEYLNVLFGVQKSEFSFFPSSGDGF